jgi:metal-dependent HD superfamily phosphatase/phosphodiesterase
LAGIYEEPDLTTVASEVMHAIIAHSAKETCLTIESGVLKVADALDMTEGRSRIPFETGKVNIHSVSAQAVDSVDIEKGDERPVKLVIRLANSAGIFQVDELLRNKLKKSTIKEYVEIVAKIEGETERRLIKIYKA